MKKRVVITGLGICSPIGVGLPDFTESLKNGYSGIKFIQQLEELRFSCHLGAIPDVSEEKKREYLTELQLRNFMSSGIMYGIIAGMDALKDANIEPAKVNEDPLWDLGIIFGTGVSSVEKMRESLRKVDEKKGSRLSSNTVPQVMSSGVSAYLGGLIGAGNIVTTNSSACSTGTEALLLGYERIKSGKAKQMLCGSSSDHGPYIWAGFDSIRVTNYKYNNEPENLPGPMNANAGGFAPGSGAGAYLLESLESAQERGAIIYAEILGGAINNGGQRGDGSMTAPNGKAIQRCIENALEDSNIEGSDIEYINGHLTSTIKDPDEIGHWSKALKRSGNNFPYINSLKGAVGHCIAACASIEIVSALIQMQEGFIFKNKNCEPIHPEILNKISADKIPTETIYKPFNIMAKASFGFGDVNACVIFQKFKI